MYTGIAEIILDEAGLADYYQNGFVSNIKEKELLENQYVLIKDLNDNIIEYLVVKQGQLQKVKYPKFDCNFTGKIKPRNPEQYFAMDMLKDRDVPIKLITGKFGTGKTMLCTTAAIEQIENGNFEKLIFVRNNVQVKDTDPLGALPGSELDKIMPYVMPIADHCGGIDGLRYLIQKGQIEAIPLAFLRGRSIKNAILYSTEGENLTKEHLQLIIGRVDEGSELWLDGDFKQRDKDVFTKTHGLETMIERLKGNSLFGYVHLTKSERSKVAAIADLLD